MKKKIILIVVIVVILGTVLGIIDYSRIKNNEMPIFMVRITNTSKQKLNYIGLGYRMQRFVGVSYKESLVNDNYVKFGFWFYIWKIENIKNSDDDLINTNNKIKNITFQELKDIKNGMTYREIITKLGATRDEGYGIHSAVYLIDNNNLLYISFADINDTCEKSGEELYEQMKNFILIDKAFDYLDTETKSKIINLYQTNITNLKIEDNAYLYLNKNSEKVEIRNKEIILVNFETDTSIIPNNIIVIIEADKEEVLGLGLID